MRAKYLSLLFIMPLLVQCAQTTSSLRDSVGSGIDTINVRFQRYVAASIKYENDTDISISRWDSIIKSQCRASLFSIIDSTDSLAQRNFKITEPVLYEHLHDHLLLVRNIVDTASEISGDYLSNSMWTLRISLIEAKREILEGDEFKADSSKIANLTTIVNQTNKRINAFSSVQSDGSVTKDTAHNKPVTQYDTVYVIKYERDDLKTARDVSMILTPLLVIAVMVFFSKK